MLRPLLSYFRPHRLPLIPIVLASAFEMFFNAQIPLSVKFMIDRALLGHDQQMMVMILGALAVSSLVVTVASVARDYMYARIVGNIMSSTRQRMFEQLQRLSMNFYSRADTGDVMSRFSKDVGVVETALADGVVWGLQPFLDLLLSIVLVFTLEWRLAAFGVLLCPILVLGPRRFSSRAALASVAKQEHEGRILSSLQETLMAPAAVRAFNLQDSMVANFRERNRQLVAASLRLGFLTSLIERSATFGTLILQAIVMGISGYLAFRGSITIGTFASFQALFVSLSYSFMYLTQYVPRVITAGGGVQRIEELLGEQPQIQDAPDAASLAPFATAIELRDVDFSYSGAQRGLGDVTLRIPRGMSAALVGPSGSGKSTVLNLLLRFYDPDHGGVFVDDTDLRHVTQASLRAQMAVVFQESLLFNTTIRENIALGRLDATDADIVAAAQAAEIHDFIMSLPDGYDTMAGERGNRFSGGQRQRIAIARAMVKNPSILLLDEATSALDPATEHAVNATLARIARGRTLISVTHRLGSVRNIDRIFLFDHGHLVEQGSHAELAGAGGAYARLWHKQAGVHVSDDSDAASVSAEWLSEVPLLRDVAITTLWEIARWFVTERFAADRVIVHQGDPGDRFYILVRGRVDVVYEEDGRSTTVATLEDGDYFGEQALLVDQPRNATVRTVAASTCLSLARDRFTQLLEREPGLREALRYAAAHRGAR